MRRLRSCGLPGTTSRSLSGLLELRRRFEAWVHGRGDEDDEALEADLLAALGEDWFGLLWLPPGLLDAEGRSLWIEEMDFDPRPVFAQVRVPTLLYGDADSCTPVQPSVSAWRAAHEEAEVVVVRGAEHDLTLPDGRIAPEYEQKLLAWLDLR